MAGVVVRLEGRRASCATASAHGEWEWVEACFDELAMMLQSRRMWQADIE